MYTLLICLTLVQSQSAAGSSFFKVVNTSDKKIIIQIADTEEKFSQIITLEKGASQWVAVKQGSYNCGLANGKMKKCDITAGQILQIELPWEDNVEKKNEEKPAKEKAKEPVVKTEKKKEKKEKPSEKVEKPPDKEEEEKEPSCKKTQAILEIANLPADGRMWIDSVQATKQKWYKTPDTLKPGVDYFYIIRAEVDRNGSTYVDTKRVTVKAGHKTTVQFNLPR